MPFAAILLPLVAQVGPFSANPGAARSTPVEQGVRRPAKPAPWSLVQPAAQSGRGQECLAQVDEDADDAVDVAQAWLANGAKSPAEQAEAQLCLGLAQSRLEDWSAAETAFLASRDASGADRQRRARLGAMAGDAALAAGANERALAALDAARADAAGLSDPALTVPIALDRARALVALKRPDEAAAALAEARAAAPDNPEAWLLSATLSRRQGHLAEAQAQIVRAAELAPIDPAVGLEAGVIAMLAGREEPARKSWASVVAAAPDSPEAETAKGYLAQLPPAPPSSAATVPRPSPSPPAASGVRP